MWMRSIVHESKILTAPSNVQRNVFFCEALAPWRYTSGTGSMQLGCMRLHVFLARSNSTRRQLDGPAVNKILSKNKPGTLIVMHLVCPKVAGYFEWKLKHVFGGVVVFAIW